MDDISERAITGQVSAPREADEMDAIVQRAYGDADVFEHTRLPRPEPGRGEVLVRVAAAGIDRGTWHLMTGEPLLLRLGVGLRRPRRPVPGMDAAGTIAAVGEGVSRFRVGDRVFGTAKGSFAQYALADESSLALTPPALSDEQAGVACTSGLAALHAVRSIGRVRPGQEVLVTGASGGVGSFAVQLAAAAGAHVTAVASGEKAEFVRSLGAAEVVDYRTTDVASLPRRFDLIVDINGRLPLGRLRRRLAPRGTLVIVGGEGGGLLSGGMQRQLSAPLRSLFSRQKLTFLVSIVDAASLEQLRSVLASGQVVPAVGATYPLREVARGMRDLVAGRVSGKAAITVPE